MTQKTALSTLLLLLTLMVGCGDNKQKLTGTVVFSDDGSPLQTGIVILESNNKIGRGEIGSDGKFVVGFESEKDGIPKGETYKVTIVNALDETKTDRTGVSTPLIDNKYSDPNKSGLTFTADGKTNSLDLKVDRYQK